MKLTDIQATVGGAIARQLTTPILFFNNEAFTRDDIVHKLGLGNWHACALLSATLKRLHIMTAKQLARLGPMDLYRLKGVSHTQVFVAMCLLDYYEEDVRAWWGWDIKGESVQRRARDQKRKRGAQDMGRAKRVPSLDQPARNLVEAGA